eukprot:427486_1
MGNYHETEETNNNKNVWKVSKKFIKNLNIGAICAKKIDIKWNSISFDNVSVGKLISVCIDEKDKQLYCVGSFASGWMSNDCYITITNYDILNEKWNIKQQQILRRTNGKRIEGYHYSACCDFVDTFDDNQLELFLCGYLKFIKMNHSLSLDIVNIIIKFYGNNKAIHMVIKSTSEHIIYYPFDNKVESKGYIMKHMDAEKNGKKYFVSVLSKLIYIPCNQQLVVIGYYKMYFTSIYDIDWKESNIEVPIECLSEYGLIMLNGKMIIIFGGYAKRYYNTIYFINLVSDCKAWNWKKSCLQTPNPGSFNAVQVENDVHLIQVGGGSGHYVISIKTLLKYC